MGVFEGAKLAGTVSKDCADQEGAKIGMVSSATPTLLNKAGREWFAGPEAWCRSITCVQTPRLFSGFGSELTAKLLGQLLLQDLSLYPGTSLT